MGAMIAGLEMGGTKCMVVLGEGPGAVHEQVRLPTEDPETTFAAIERQLDTWAFDAIGIASFGPLDLDPQSPGYGSIVATPKPGWSGTDLLGRLRRRYAKPIAIQTDVNGAALAEGRWGGAQGMASHCYITIGTGVGVGVIAAGKPLQGFAHGEAGHMRVARAPGDGFAGMCRFHRDCVEGLISGPALARRFGRPAEQLSHDAPEWKLVVHDLAGMLHNLLVTLAPERIAIGGGVVGARPELFGPLRAELARSIAGYGLLEAWMDDAEQRLGPPALGAMAGPLGAIALGLEAFER